jgi:hypothetical protein
MIASDVKFIMNGANPYWIQFQVIHFLYLEMAGKTMKNKRISK